MRDLAIRLEGAIAAALDTQGRQRLAAELALDVDRARADLVRGADELGVLRESVARLEEQATKAERRLEEGVRSLCKHLDEQLGAVRLGLEQEALRAALEAVGERLLEGSALAPAACRAELWSLASDPSRVDGAVVARQRLAEAARTLAEYQAELEDRLNPGLRASVDHQRRRRTELIDALDTYGVPLSSPLIESILGASAMQLQRLVREELRPMLAEARDEHASGLAQAVDPLEGLRAALGG